MDVQLLQITEIGHAPAPGDRSFFIPVQITANSIFIIKSGYQNTRESTYSTREHMFLSKSTENVLSDKIPRRDE